MMEFPQIPTDNLYKFMAVSGIILVVVSLIPFLHAHKLNVEAIRLNGEYKILEEEINLTQIDIQFLESDIDRLTHRVDKSKEDTFDRRKKMSDKESLDKINEEITKDVKDIEDDKREVVDRLEKIKEIQRRYSILNLQLHAKYVELQYLNKVIHSELVAGFFSCAGGSILATIGFMLWYRRLQALQDKIVRSKADGVDSKTLKNVTDE